MTTIDPEERTVVAFIQWPPVAQERGQWCPLSAATSDPRELTVMAFIQLPPVARRGDSGGHLWPRIVDSGGL